MGGILFFVILVLVIAYFCAGIKIVQQEQAMIIERLGAFEKELYAGFHIIVPFFEYPRKIKWKYSKNIDGRSYSFESEKTII